MIIVTTGTIRCSYSCYNAMDEVEAANSITFNLQGDRVYAGSNRMIRSFDTANPGGLVVMVMMIAMVLIVIMIMIAMILIVIMMMMILVKILIVKTVKIVIIITTSLYLI